MFIVVQCMGCVQKYDEGKEILLDFKLGIGIVVEGVMDCCICCVDQVIGENEIIGKFVNDFVDFVDDVID